MDSFLVALNGNLDGHSWLPCSGIKAAEENSAGQRSVLIPLPMPGFWALDFPQGPLQGCPPHQTHQLLHPEPQRQVRADSRIHKYWSQTQIWLGPCARPALDPGTIHSGEGRRVCSCSSRQRLHRVKLSCFLILVFTC